MQGFTYRALVSPEKPGLFSTDKMLKGLYTAFHEVEKKLSALGSSAEERYLDTEFATHRV